MHRASFLVPAHRPLPLLRASTSDPLGCASYAHSYGTFPRDLRRRIPVARTQVAAAEARRHWSRQYTSPAATSARPIPAIDGQACDSSTGAVRDPHGDISNRDRQSQDLPTTCRGRTSSGRPCMRKLDRISCADGRATSDEGVRADATFLCWQHHDQDQAGNVVQGTAHPPPDSDTSQEFHGFWSLEESLQSIEAGHHDHCALEFGLDDKDPEDPSFATPYAAEASRDEPRGWGSTKASSDESSRCSLKMGTDRTFIYSSADGQESPDTPFKDTEQNLAQGTTRRVHIPTHFETLWTAAPKPHKHDLSYGDPSLGRKAKRKPADDRFDFRADAGSSLQRRMTKYVMRHVYHHVSASQDISDAVAVALLQELNRVDPSGKKVDMDHVLRASWILLANPGTSVRRIRALAAAHQSTTTPPVELWVILQLLRTPRLGAKPVPQLLDFVDTWLHTWHWGGNPAFVLFVRLLRHARIDAPAHAERITSLFLRLLSLRFPRDSVARDKQRLCQWCNSALTLLGLPAHIHPFRSMIFQQRAQLAIVQFMIGHAPQIPITREGYRALYKLQATHSKTGDEAEWAHAQTLKWPPWEEQVRMGATERPKEYPGQQSRMLKVMKRMQEAGFALNDTDHAHRILAGRDTDNSPTIQVRRTTNFLSFRTPQLVSPGYDCVGQARIWAARIEATRTVREAWMCFCSFDHSTPTKTQATVVVFHAMLRKLWAKPAPPRKEDGGPLPGDGLEVYPDPDLPRDRVYIPEEIPTAERLFTRMTEHNIMAPARLLSDLLKHEIHFSQGLHYIAWARMAPAQKQILMAPDESSAVDVAKALNALPMHLARAYILWLARPRISRDERSLLFGKPGPIKFSGPVFAWFVLQSVGTDDLLTWNDYLLALSLHETRRGKRSGSLSLTQIWVLITTVIAERGDRPVSLGTLSAILPIAFRVQAQTDAESWSEAQIPRPTDLVKQMFVRAVTGDHHRPPAFEKICRETVDPKLSGGVWMPTPDVLEAMVWVFGAARTESSINDIIHLLQWIYRNQKHFRWTKSPLTRRNITAFRIVLEGLWADKATRASGKQIFGADREQMAEARRLCSKISGGWPDNENVALYMRREGVRARVERMRKLYTVGASGRDSATQVGGAAEK